MSVKFVRFTVLLILCVVICSPSYSTVLLKPYAQISRTLFLKKLTENVTIDKQFASSDMTMSFQNDTSRRIEADFIYTVPEGGVVTGFAYWYGDEKVVARVVEKKRAAKIYSAITAPQRDPALIELVGKNTFRARIFPVAPNSDLKVKLTYVQTLHSDSKGLVYKLPLYEFGEEKNVLDSININVHVKQDKNINSVTSNYGIPISRKKDGWHFAFSGTDYHPQKDLQIRLTTKDSTLRAALYSAKSGGSNGFFALALNPNQSIRNPRITISGVRTSDICKSRLSNTLLVFGRYTGSGYASVNLSGGSSSKPIRYQETVHFSSDYEPNNLASKLWAARKIELLGSGKSGISEIMKLSMRYTIPSKYTSWLAIPTAERQQFQRVILQSDIDKTAKQLFGLLYNKKENTRKAKLLRSKLDSLCKKADMHSKDAIEDIANPKLEVLYQKLLNANSAERPDYKHIDSLWKQINALKPYASFYITQRFSWNSGYLYEKHRNILAGDLTKEMNSKTPNKKRIESLKKQITAISTSYKGKEYASAYNDFLEWGIKWQKLKDIMDAAEAKQDYVTERKYWDEWHEIKKTRDRMYDKLHARWGDPLISVDAPSSARSVTALMPSGEIKKLLFNSKTSKWEGRFDVPGYASQGKYTITIVIVTKDGKRMMRKMEYHVDTTAPHGRSSIRMVTNPNHMLRLEMDADPDTYRVVALLPWQKRVEMRHSSRQYSFFALVPVPAKWIKSDIKVTFTLLDKAHNRTVMTAGIHQ